MYARASEGCVCVCVCGIEFVQVIVEGVESKARMF